MVDFQYKNSIITTLSNGACHQSRTTLSDNASPG
jgi:hypothetical protein